MPSWLTRTRESVTDDPQKFSTELSIIYKYSPYKTEAELMRQFDTIYGKCGKIIETLKFWWKCLFSVFWKALYVCVHIFSLYNITWHLTWGNYLFYPYKFYIKRIQTYNCKSLTVGDRFVLPWTWWKWMRRGWYKLRPQGLRSRCTRYQD